MDFKFLRTVLNTKYKSVKFSNLQNNLLLVIFFNR